MGKGRLEAFSDGVLAIIITIMVLEVKIPQGDHPAALLPLAPLLLSYALSFLYVGIYWINHHHFLHAVTHVTGGILWANLHLLFWLSLLPVITGWVGAHPTSPWPAAFYGIVLLAAAGSWLLLQRAIASASGVVARALGGDLKGKLSPVIYVLGITLAFVRPWISDVLYAGAALMWVVPDRRIARAVAKG